MHAPCCSTSLPEHGLPNPSATQTGVRLHCLEPQTPGKIRKLESIQNKAASIMTHKYDRTMRNRTENVPELANHRVQAGLQRLSDMV